jgi:hypothetical protein
MKRFLPISFITLALSLTIAAQEHTKRPTTPPPSSTPRVTADPIDEGGWVRFTSELGRFSVLMPVTPAEDTKTEQSEHGPYTTRLFIARDTRNVYLIGWVDYDPSFNFNLQSEMNANRDNFVKGVNATLLNSQTVTVDGYRVLEFTAETAEQIFRSRVYMVGRRPYQIVIGSPKGLEDAASVRRFFNSFKITRR